jgi:signal transduction histidine kinase/CheY-like chemotaxis protein
MSLDFHPIASAQQLADVIPHGLAILNHNYELVSGNLNFQTLIPCSDANFLDCWLQSIHSDDVNRVNGCFNRAESSKAALRVEYRARSQDTWCLLTLNPLLANKHAFGLGTHGGFIVTVADITPEKKAEFSQRQLVKDAQEQKQLQERFIDMISHEIRNPLSAILHCTEDIIEAVREKEDHIVPLPRITESAETICLCISHQKRMLDDVLTFSKIDASMLHLAPRRMQPKRHFTGPISLFRPQLQRNDIEFDYQADISYESCGIEWVMADLDRMGQVLINLLSNAIKFTARSKNTRNIRVSIGASNDRPSSYPPNIVFFPTDDTALGLDKTTSPEWGDGDFAYIMLAVKDTGIGIDDHAQRRLFERFNQATPRTEGVYGGSGLGLNVSRKLCHLHGGEIGVSSKEGEGSTFGFFFRVRKEVYTSGDDVDAYNVSEVDKLSHNIQALGVELSEVEGPLPDVRISKDPPLKQIDELNRGGSMDERTKHTRDIAQQAVDPSNETYQRQIDESPGRRILVVEDNVINRRILSRKLRSLGFQIMEASNGLEALNTFQNSRFDCILMDQEMPVMDGNAATKRIRELENGNDTHIPIFGVTANVRAAQRSEMLDAGMDDIIHKPYHFQEIVAKISQFVPATLEMTKT